MEIFTQTERLVLRRLIPADVDNLVELDSDPEVMRFLTGGAPTPREVIQDRILPTFLRSYQRFEGFGVWAAIEKSSGDFIGWFSFQPPEEGGPENVSLGYRLRRVFWGRGFATEGARALIHIGFSQLGVKRVFATTYEYNLASRRVLEKAGLRLERRFRFTREDLLAQKTFDSASSDDDEPWEGDDVEYALRQDEWERQAADVSLPAGDD
jgi:RimJ/RimL family protein N-acetyltransferase